MSLELLGALVLLALADSTTFGTLLIPLWLILAPGRLRPGRILLFLTTVAVFYLLLGIGLLAGAATVFDLIERVALSRPVRMAELVVGVVMMVVGLAMRPWTGTARARRLREWDDEETPNRGRLTQWRARAMDGSAPIGAVLTLAITAAAIEAASMLPYLAAIGLLTTSDLGFPQRSLALVGYCLVMIVPALSLLTIRIVFHEQVAPTLARVEDWIARNSQQMTAWVVVLIGGYLALDAIGALR